MMYYMGQYWLITSGILEDNGLGGKRIKAEYAFSTYIGQLIHVAHTSELYIVLDTEGNLERIGNV